MVLTGDWLTPKLPYPEGLVSYLGKPPLHFWATAASISLFGMDEWSARLPSTIALGIAALVLVGIGRLSKSTTGQVAAMILVSSAVVFYLAGSVVTDVSLMAAVSIALLGYALRVFTSSRATLSLILISLGLAAGFLIKGPVAVILTVLPLILFHLLRRERPRLPLRECAIIIAAVLTLVLPWFIATERVNPGFTEYFFWNENVLRFLTPNYGDRFGAGHVHLRGSAWWMMLLATLPWTPLLLMRLVPVWREVRTGALSPLKAFALCWMIAPPLFFTLCRQLHIGYILPALPGAALLLAIQLEELPLRRIEARILLVGLLALLIGVVLALAAHLVVGSGSIAAFTVVAVLAAAGAMYRGLPTTARAALLICLSLAGIQPVIARELDERNSTREALLNLTGRVGEESPVVGIVTTNTFSHYLYNLAWREEIGEQVKLVYLRGDEPPSELPNYLLISTGDLKELSSRIRGEFVEHYHGGKWHWLARGGVSVGELTSE